MEFTIEYIIEPVDNGTNMTFHQTAGELGGFFGKLADPLVVRLYQRDVWSNLEKLKELLES